ncbi:MAG: hypothetical protein D6800_10495 [Candidatus Zixiibacteriota bacterium]|nr:MAG: hypothetical protein D6800_10495 [candidate division Zixibacteria bacterium]
MVLSGSDPDNPFNNPSQCAAGSIYTAVLPVSNVPSTNYLFVGAAQDTVSGQTYWIFESCIESNDFVVNNEWIRGQAENVLQTYYFGFQFNRMAGPANCCD